jgi:hypothetical protein
MCGENETLTGSAPSPRQVSPESRLLAVDDLLPFAQAIVDQKQVRRSAAGFVGYGGARDGERILVGIDNHYHPAVVDAVVRALRGAGARVDVIETDLGPDREFDELDEVRAIIRRRSFLDEPRRWEGARWIEERALRDGYDLLILGKGGGPPRADGPYPTPARYESIPWLQPEHLSSDANRYPLDLHMLINELTWRPIEQHGRRGRMHLTDVEGTDLSWTLLDDAWAPGQAFGRPIHWGHLHAHSTTPVPELTDAAGVVRGTTSHFARPFPRLSLTVESGRLRGIEGGGAYGEAWRELDAATRGVHYPVFPGPGLFFMVEVAIGTNPFISRALDISHLSSGGTEWERRRSGVMHLGFGTFWRDAGEVWAAERDIPYGHLHVHLLFPTLDLETTGGRQIRIIDAGHLTAMDDPRARDLAARYGDPDDLLSERWIPALPGLNAPGSLDSYFADPAAWIYPRA